MSNIEVSIRDKAESDANTQEKIRKNIKKIDRYIKKADAKIRAYEKQIAQINSISADTQKQVELGLQLLGEDIKGEAR